jgi:hypothetical protein
VRLEEKQVYYKKNNKKIYNLVLFVAQWLDIFILQQVDDGMDVDN